MSRLQSFILTTTFLVCLAVGLWASQRSINVKSPLATTTVVADDAGPPLESEFSDVIPAVANEPSVSPRRLTDEDALPAADHPVRRAIDRLMPKASVEERQIWFEEFRELPVSAVEDLLKLRKDSNAATPLVPAEPSLSPIECNVISNHTLRALTQERWVALHNLQNANTPGYRALESQRLPRPFDITELRWNGIPDAYHLLRIRLDTRSGPFEQTDRPLDLAIKGAGWFVVDDEQGQPAYTRYGALRLNDQRELELPAIAAGRPLSPRITIPESIAQIYIDADGVVYGGEEFGKWNTEQPLGQIRLVRFFDDSALAVHKDGLYRPTPAAGAMTSCVPGKQAGTLECGALERSNVRREAEEQMLIQIEHWLQRFSTASP